jgi:hypothetical protein
MEVRPGYKQTEVCAIPADWQNPEIRSVCKLINGRGFKPFEWKASGLPIIRIQNEKTLSVMARGQAELNELPLAAESWRL